MPKHLPLTTLAILALLAVSRAAAQPRGAKSDLIQTPGVIPVGIVVSPNDFPPPDPYQPVPLRRPRPKLLNRFPLPQRPDRVFLKVKTRELKEGHCALDVWYADLEGGHIRLKEATTQKRPGQIRKYSQIGPEPGFYTETFTVPFTGKNYHYLVLIASGLTDPPPNKPVEIVTVPEIIKIW